MGSIKGREFLDLSDWASQEGDALERMGWGFGRRGSGIMILWFSC
jgi:hypothetical protein